MIRGGAARRLADGVPGLDSGWFAFLNFQGSTVVDASAPAQVARLAELLGQADVIIDSLDSARRRSLGVDHEALRQRRPGLVIADLSWFGHAGPYAGYRGTDAVCRALAGQVQLIGPAEGPPLALPDFQAAIVAGLSAFIALMASLPGADRVGGGLWDVQRVDG